VLKSKDRHLALEISSRHDVASVKLLWPLSCNANPSFVIHCNIHGVYGGWSPEPGCVNVIFVMVYGASAALLILAY